MGYVILLWHSLSLPYNFFECDTQDLCDKVWLSMSLFVVFFPLAAEHTLPLIVHCRGLNNTDGRAVGRGCSAFDRGNRPKRSTYSQALLYRKFCISA